MWIAAEDENSPIVLDPLSHSPALYHMIGFFQICANPGIISLFEATHHVHFCHILKGIITLKEK
jgi:hypothetical protein